jgi:hypothetical protein
MTTVDSWYEASAKCAATSCSIIVFRYAAQNIFETNEIQIQTEMDTFYLSYCQFTKLKSTRKEKKKSLLALLKTPLDSHNLLSILQKAQLRT